MATQRIRQEALQESRQITWRDRKFTIPPIDDWLLDFSHHMERDHITLALEAMLGSEQYEEFRTASPRPKLTEVEGLMSSITSSFGVEVGES